MNEKNEIRKFIMEHINEEECNYLCDDKVFNCCECSNFETCRMMAEMRCSDDLNTIFVEAINNGVYDSAEEFWEQIFD